MSFGRPDDTLMLKAARPIMQPKSVFFLWVVEPMFG
jgi:hypothetical protein